MIMGRLYFMTTQYFTVSACLKSGSGSQKLQVAVWALINSGSLCRCSKGKFNWSETCKSTTLLFT